MYTPEMASAFKNISAPKGFGVVLYENDDFLTMEIDPKELINLSDDDKVKAVEYVNQVKKTLESFGAIVFIVRKALEE
jgi:hypothetical protein